jgi:Rieske Fe-S protein
MATSFDRRAFLCAGCSVMATACGVPALDAAPTFGDTGTSGTEPTDTGPAPPEYPCGQVIEAGGAGWTGLPLADYPDLAEVGGWYGVGSLIIVHALEGCYVAMDRACSHEGILVNYKPDRAQFVCPQHGAIYDLQGDKVAGPQPTGLPVYPCGRVGDTIWYKNTPLS